LGRIAGNVAPSWNLSLILRAKDILAGQSDLGKKLAARDKKMDKKRGMVDKKMDIMVKKLDKVQTSLGFVQEIALAETFQRQGVLGRSAHFRGAHDLLATVLPSTVVQVMSREPQLTGRGFLMGVSKLVEKEGVPQAADNIRQVLETDSELTTDAGKKTVCSTLQMIKDEFHNKASKEDEEANVEVKVMPAGLTTDIDALFRYARGSWEQRMQLLKDELFVRCAAALLLDRYTGVLEVDAGAGVGCTVDVAAQALRLRLGESKLNPAELPAAQEQLLAVSTLAAFAVDKVVAACRESKVAGVSELPQSLLIDGVCVFSGTVHRNQLCKLASGTRVPIKRSLAFISAQYGSVH
ncbi:hypothetical protein TSOC_011700, partial [Tetrabaena socialis]